MAIESVCTKLGQQDTEEVRAEINRVLRSSHPMKPNLTKVQSQAIGELKRDRGLHSLNIRPRASNGYNG